MNRDAVIALTTVAVGVVCVGAFGVYKLSQSLADDETQDSNNNNNSSDAKRTTKEKKKKQTNSSMNDETRTPTATTSSTSTTFDERPKQSNSSSTLQSNTSPPHSAASAKIYDFVMRSLEEAIANNGISTLDPELSITFDKVLMPKSTFTTEQDAMRTQGVIRLLISLLSTPTTTSAALKNLTRAGFVLSNISLNPRNHEQVIDAVEPMLDRVSMVDSFKEDALTILPNITNYIGSTACSDSSELASAEVPATAPNYPEKQLCQRVTALAERGALMCIEDKQSATCLLALKLLHNMKLSGMTEMRDERMRWRYDNER
jgi:hypothetical protein